MSSADLPLHEDPGVQPERTLLAWTRTLLLLLVLAGFLLRWIPYQGAAVLTLVGGCSLVALGIFVGERARYRRAVHGILDESYPAAVRSVLGLTAAVMGIGLAALILLLSGEAP
ncbi:DUF202 domain-containing protein [Nesterenkonia sp. NBAIMH1]|uniref:DUF202 domain-containing protein n=1 Tax=Nesterenkonia sp. NBAIMH1 TaxID=2600320 RepID=UPI0011B84E0A|nr:DUF202 domain-containing protein [Nesterenkonia sp. NBAIMH1]